MASTTTKLSNIINPEVMSDMIEAKIEAQCKICLLYTSDAADE